MGVDTARRGRVENGQQKDFKLEPVSKVNQEIV